MNPKKPRSGEGKRSKPPERIWLEQWPPEADRQDDVHFEQTGYGDDLRGNTSRIAVYVRDDEKQARLDAIATIVVPWRNLESDRLPLGALLRATKVLASWKPARECARLVRKYAKGKP